MYKSHFPKSPDLPPPHNQPFPTTNSSGKGDKSHRQPLHHPPILATGHRHPHRPMKDLSLTLGQMPMPKELLSAIWCRYSSVLEAEKAPEVRRGGVHPPMPVAWQGRWSSWRGAPRSVPGSLRAAPGPGPTSQIFLTHCAHSAPPQCRGSLDKRVTD